MPYELAVYLSRQFVGNTEKGEALEQQVGIDNLNNYYGLDPVEYYL